MTVCVRVRVCVLKNNSKLSQNLMRRRRKNKKQKNKTKKQEEEEEEEKSRSFPRGIKDQNNDLESIILSSNGHP